jgi:hypothetical protein
LLDFEPGFPDPRDPGRVQITMVQYLSLEEAAQILGISPERLKDMAERNEVRPFRDRGSMRFRSQEIEELARRMGKHSDPELQIGEIPPARAGDSPSRRQAKAGPEVFNFSLGDDAEKVDLGAEPRSPGSSKSKRGMSPAPKPGSDSDVRLVADGSDLDFQIAQDSKVRLVQDPEPTAKTGSGKRKGNPDAQGDSGVRILGPTVQSDSDVKILPPGPEDSDVILGLQPGKKASDSDIRLEHDKGGHSGSGLRRGKGAPDDSLVTEEINLDLDMPKEGKGDTGLSGLLKSKGKGKGGPADSQSKKPTSGKKTDSSSDFELTPASAKDQSPLELGSDEEVSLGELTGKAGDSGINLQDPADSGISLEQGSGEEALEFDLAPDASSTPKPGPIQKEDSDSEFELSMDDSSSEEHPKLKGEPDSDSEFELTLDDSGDLLPMEESGKKGGAAGEGDIFETDFEVPALEEDSGSQVAALDESDTDLENSEFDLALGD